MPTDNQNGMPAMIFYVSPQVLTDTAIEPSSDADLNKSPADVLCSFPCLLAG
jgi:hypothetical protein